MPSGITPMASTVSAEPTVDPSQPVDVQDKLSRLHIEKYGHQKSEMGVLAIENTCDFISSPCLDSGQPWGG